MNTRVLTGLALLLLAITAGCKDATLDPILNGSISGVVLDYETNEPLNRAGITTTPATSSIISNAAGLYELLDIPAGTYSVAASLPGYLSNSVSVTVREKAITQAIIFLKKDVSDTTSKARMTVDIVNWTNQVGNDSTRVTVEYRVRNLGTVKIPSYEVYFRIKSADRFFYQEEKGVNLDVGQADIGRFQKYIMASGASEVAIDNTWYTGKL